MFVSLPEHHGFDVSIGGNAHADVHCLAHTPGDSSRLWTGTDGGLYLNMNPTGAGQFEHRNSGLATLCTNYLSQNPAEPAVVFVGLQDNGTAKCTGESVWRHVLFADGGYCIVNWNDPFRILLFANGTVYRATDCGLDYGSWTAVTPSGAHWVVIGCAARRHAVEPGESRPGRSRGLCTIKVHRKFGTGVIMLPGGLKVDVASARLEYYDHPAALPKVEWSSIKLDLYRRDFTINTLAIQLNRGSWGNLTDYFTVQRGI